MSYEPALGPVDFRKYFDEGLECNYCNAWRGTEDDATPDGNKEDPGFLCPSCGESVAHLPLNECLDQIIVGGESGPGARPFDIGWARHTVEQCKATDVACFVKQLGAWVMSSDGTDWIGHPGDTEATGNGLEIRWRIRLKDRKGGDMAEWPEDLRVRELIA